MKKRRPTLRSSAGGKISSVTATIAERPIDRFMANLNHPLAREIAEVRRAILAADATIADDIKWNSLSFRTTEFFATVHLRSTDSVQLVFHAGAKARGIEVKIDLPPELNGRRLAADRCLLSLGAGAELAARLPVLQRFVRAWIRFV